MSTENAKNKVLSVKAYQKDGNRHAQVQKLSRIIVGGMSIFPFHWDGIAAIQLDGNGVHERSPQSKRSAFSRRCRTKRRRSLLIGHPSRGGSNADNKQRASTWLAPKPVISTDT